MRQLKGYRHLKKGGVLPRDSLTRAFNQRPENISSAKEEVDDTDVAGWFHVDQEIDAIEEVVWLGSYGMTLTVITAEVPDEDDEESVCGWRPPQFRY